MKNTILTLALLAGAATMTAQNADPNRMLVNGAAGMTGFNLERVQDITFATIDGPVAAEVTILSSSTTELKLDVERTSECYSFMINVFPSTIAAQIVANPGSAKAYMERYNSPVASEDFVGGTLSGLDLAEGSDYAVVTLGMDKYGIDGDVCTASFSTPSKPLVGNPEVAWKVDDTTLTTFKMTFTPNDDAYGYACVAYKKGTFDEQYEMYGPMFGFANKGDMVKAWGLTWTDEQTYEWTSMDPNTEYEVYIQCWDQNETYAPLIVAPVSTLSQGGTGEAKVDVTLGDYVLADWGAETKLPSQFVNYTPNDQTWRYRFGVYTAAQYAGNEEAIKAEVMSEPPMPDMAYWWWYEPMSTDYQINENTEFVVIAAGQNANGEWGTLTEFKATTPASVSGAPAMKSPQAARQLLLGKRFTPVRKGFLPGTTRVTLTK